MVVNKTRNLKHMKMSIKSRLLLNKPSRTFRTFIISITYKYKYKMNAYIHK